MVGDTRLRQFGDLTWIGPQRNTRLAHVDFHGAQFVFQGDRAHRGRAKWASDSGVVEFSCGVDESVRIREAEEEADVVAV